MIETVGTMLESIQIMNLGIIVIIISLILLIARGMSKKTSGILEIMFVLSLFVMVALLPITTDNSKMYTFFFIIFLIIVYVFRYIMTDKNDYE